MGVLPIVLMILAMKIPIIGLTWFVFWVGRVPEPEGPAEEKIRAHKPCLPDSPLGRRGPRRRGPHGGAAARAALPAAHDGSRVHAPAVAKRVVPAGRH